MKLHLLSLAISGLLMLHACKWPNPVPPTPDGGTGGQPPIATGGQNSTGGASPIVTGGAVATGGTSAVPVTTAPDGKALCIASMTADPVRQAEARDNNMTVAQLASKACSYKAVQACFAKGVCK